MGFCCVPAIAVMPHSLLPVSVMSLVCRLSLETGPVRMLKAGNTGHT